MNFVQKYMLPFIISNIFEPAIHNCFKKVAALSRKYLSDPILVICSGAGGQCFYIKMANKQSIGIDKDFNMVLQSTKRYPYIPFICCDASKLPFKDNVFKGIILTFALHDKNNELREQFISEAKKVSIKNCNFILTDFGVPRNPFEKCGHIYTFITEFFSGHFSNGMDFLKCGAIDAVAEKHNFMIIDRIKNGLRNSESVVLKKN